MVSDSLDDILTPRRTGEGRFVLEVRDGWQQGRGLFGGIMAGGLARAASAVVRDARPLRALDAQLLAPVQTGEVEIDVVPLREGNAVSTLRAEAKQGGIVVAHAVAVCAASRPDAPQWSRLEPPRPRPWQGDAPLTLPSPPAPVFTKHFEYRTEWGFPYSGNVGARVEGWIRPRIPARRRDAALVAALADAWWPVVVVEMSTPRAIGTVTFGLEIFLTDLPGDAPLCYRATTPAAQDGYVTEFRELWTEDGRLVALNQQVIAVMK
jgi:acyl-CoA thioesterase